MKKIFEKVKKVAQKVKDFFKGVIDKIFNIVNDHKETIEAVGLTVFYCAGVTIGIIYNVYGDAYNKGFTIGNRIGYMDGIYKGYGECMNFVKTCLASNIPDNDIIGG